MFMLLQVFSHLQNPQIYVCNSSHMRTCLFLIELDSNATFLQYNNNVHCFGHFRMKNKTKRLSIADDGMNKTHETQSSFSIESSSDTLLKEKEKSCETCLY